MSGLLVGGGCERGIQHLLALNLPAAIDAEIFERALERLKNNESTICPNISAQSICDPLLVAHLAQAIKSAPYLAERLWIDIPEFVAYRHASEFRVFCDTLRPMGCKIGLEHMGSQIGRMGELYDVGLDYLKIGSAIIRDINHASASRLSWKVCVPLRAPWATITIAESVLNPQEAACLVSLGLSGMSGQGIRLDP